MRDSSSFSYSLKSSYRVNSSVFRREEAEAEAAGEAREEGGGVEAEDLDSLSGYRTPSLVALGGFGC